MITEKLKCLKSYVKNSVFIKNFNDSLVTYSLSSSKNQIQSNSIVLQ